MDTVKQILVKKCDVCQKEILDKEGWPLPAENISKCQTCGKDLCRDHAVQFVLKVESNSDTLELVCNPSWVYFCADHAKIMLEGLVNMKLIDVIKMEFKADAKKGRK
jgi:hypothetical protein